MTSGQKASARFKLSDAVGQTAAQFFTSKGYFLQAGFLNAGIGEVFSFSIHPVAVDFGNLYPAIPVEKTVRLTISNGNVPGYIVKVIESQPLLTSVEAEIMDTACDPESRACTANSAAKWAKNTTYGFGYRITGKMTPNDFVKEEFFRPFPAKKRNEQPIVIMQNQAKKVVDQGTMTFKVNISPQQPVGQYRNVISFTAMAGI